MITVPALSIVCAALLALAVGIVVGWLVRGRRTRRTPRRPYARHVTTWNEWS